MSELKQNQQVVKRRDNRKVSQSLHGKIAGRDSYPFFFGMLCRVRSKSGRGWRIRPNFKAVFLYGFFCIVGLWLALTIGVFCFYKYYKGFDSIRFTQVLRAPWARSELTSSFGEFNIANAKKMFNSGDSAAGYMNLYYGVMRSPDNLEARMDLALMRSAWFGDTEESADLLFPKIKSAYIQKNGKYLGISLVFLFNTDKYREDAYKLFKGIVNSDIMSDSELTEYIGRMISVAVQSRDNLLCAEICQKCAELVPQEKEAIRKFMAINSASAYLTLDESAKASEVLKKYGVTSGEVYLRMLADIDWNSGLEKSAITRLERLSRISKNKILAFSELSKLYMEMDCPKSAESAKKMVLLLGDIYGSQLYEIGELAKNGEENRAVAETKKFINTYKNDASAIRKLCKVAVDNKFLPIITEILSYREIPDAMKIVAKESEIVLQLKLGNAKDAHAALENFRYIKGAKALTSAIWKYEIAVYAMSGEFDRARVQIERLMSNEKFDVADIDSYINLLMSSGLYTQAIIVCQKALESNPDSVLLRLAQSKIASKVGDVETILELARKSDVRWPLSSLKALGANLKSDRTIFVSREEYGKSLSAFSEMAARIEDYKKSSLRE